MLYAMEYRELKRGEEYLSEDRELYFIYALIDPRDSKVRYIGSSVNPKGRFDSHMASPSRALRPWLEELASCGLQPRLITLADARNYQRALNLENVYIDEYQRVQGGLLNLHFALAARRKLWIDRDASKTLKKIKKAARKETDFYSQVALNRPSRGNRQRVAFY